MGTETTTLYEAADFTEFCEGTKPKLCWEQDWYPEMLDLHTLQLLIKHLSGEEGAGDKQTK